ncbi:MAG: protein translocase subunit SecD [Ardenticatenaceae bacterium]|nr:protein translocase subunit SecD [Anaerolineales bacterium]MCB9007043.1 protein translocase subunit SecD [Ardenticatenaceae bacterium]
MEGKDYIWLIVILAIAGWAAWVVENPNLPIRQGLDLQGGLQVLLKADVPEDQEIESAQLDTSRQIIEQRVNALGVAEPLVQTEGDRRILVELPGIDNPEEAVSLIQETALLEFVDTGTVPLAEGTCIRTNLNEGPSRCEFGQDGNLISTTAPTFETVMTGAAIQSAESAATDFGQYYVAFTLQADERELFANYTRENQGNFLTIVLDKQVISSPRISAVIEGQGSISGDFTLEEAQKLALQLRFGSLPIPLVIDSTRQIGATLGELSVESSIRAGAIGVAVVLLFMLIYYRLPGFLADIALVLYAAVNLAVFMALPVTLTLPAITGFLLSTGMAVDANILVFERMKEELRAGSTLREAIFTGFGRAWTSIRDSNIATLVICLVLWTFGRSFGASAVQGFALTLAIGVMISMFTAVIVTRTLVRIVMGRLVNRIDRNSWLLGV